MNLREYNFKNIVEVKKEVLNFDGYKTYMILTVLLKNGKEITIKIFLPPSLQTKEEVKLYLLDKLLEFDRKLNV